MFSTQALTPYKVLVLRFDLDPEPRTYFLLIFCFKSDSQEERKDTFPQRNTTENRSFVVFFSKTTKLPHLCKSCQKKKHVTQHMFSTQALTTYAILVLHFDPALSSLHTFSSYSRNMQPIYLAHSANSLPPEAQGTSVYQCLAYD